MSEYNEEKLSANELMKLWEKCAAGDKEARSYLIARYRKDAVNLAEKLAERHPEFDDSFKQVMIKEYQNGQVRVIDRYASRGIFTKATYHDDFLHELSWLSRQAAKKAIASQAGTVHIPVTMVETVNKLNRVQRQLRHELGRDPTAEEISQRMDGISPDKVKEIQRIATGEPMDEEDNSQHGVLNESWDAVKNRY